MISFLQEITIKIFACDMATFFLYIDMLNQWRPHPGKRVSRGQGMHLCGDTTTLICCANNVISIRHDYKPINI